MTESWRTKSETEKTINKRQYAQRLLCFRTRISFDSKAYSGQGVHDPCRNYTVSISIIPKGQ